MPTYVYECRQCERQFEAEQRIVEDPLKDCQLCGALDAVKRVIQPVGIAFKGSGFYVTDYAGSGASNSKPSPDAAAAATPASANSDASATADTPSAGTPSAPAAAGSDPKLPS